MRAIDRISLKTFPSSDSIFIDIKLILMGHKHKTPFKLLKKYFYLFMLLLRCVLEFFYKRKLS